MWTPKRILLLAAGFIVFLGCYFLYAQILGGIDGLPQLPENYRPTNDPTSLAPEPPPRPEGEADIKLRKAFGPECPKLGDCKIKMVLQKGLVLATQDFAIMPDGRVKLTPFFVAIFGKHQGDTGYDEINTVRSDVAFLRFDEPVTNILEMGRRKIIGGELNSNIYVMNNRRTPQRDDDISLFTHGPLYYQESMNLIWTDRKSVVRVTDPQSKPKPTTIHGIGLELYLSADPKPGTQPNAPRKSKLDGPSGLDKIVLRKDVDMNLWVDSQSGFLGSGKNPAAKPKAGSDKPLAAQAQPPGAEAVPPDKAKVVIRTQGPFVFDMRTNHATFDISQEAGLRNVVTVDRLNEAIGEVDNLQCDRLELQFHRNTQGAQPAKDERPEGLDIESAHATGKEVILTSDRERLEAVGTDFFYDKLKNLSTLKGGPLVAMKDGNEIQAPELQLLNEKGVQQATALGQGVIRMMDTKTGKRPLEARWKQKLIYGKDGPYDLLTLIGDAAFFDRQDPNHTQELQANLLKVWLEPAEEAKADKDAKAAEDGQAGRKPHHLEAVGRVTATSVELKVHDSEHLIIRFKDVPVAALSAQPAQSGQPAQPAAAVGQTPTKPAPSPEKPPPAETPKTTPPPLGKPPPPQGTAARSKKPVDISARLIEVDVLRSGQKSDVDKLWCEGTIHVHQDPELPEDRGVDIQGETLQMTHRVEGNVLAVTGDHAKVLLNKIFILGPEVNIDQTTNEAWVHGMGVMRMLSTADFDGNKLAKPTELTVSWLKSMEYNGQDARFVGGVRAEQETGRMACQEMQVTFDRKVSLREGDKAKEPAKVQKLVCDQEVWLEDTKRDPAGKLIAYKRIDCPELSVDNDSEKEDSDLHASGPGTVRIFQLGNKGEMFPNTPRPDQPPPKPAAKNGSGPKKTEPAKTEQETKLTHITYEGKMWANNKRGMAVFFGRVILIHVPTERADLFIDQSRPPKGSMYLTCDQLEVLTHKLPNGSTTQEMQARHKVFIEGDDFSGQADSVAYDEAKDQVILEAKEGNLAVLNQQKAPGRDGQQIKAKKILYYPKTGDFDADGSRTLKVGP
jgi:lipopolysaccharide export system protein LptA